MQLSITIYIFKWCLDEVIMIHLAIVIPARNEERRIGRTLKEYLAFFESLKKIYQIDYKILVVINNTRDKTEEIVREFQENYKSLYCINLVKGGKGYAVIEGLKECLKTNSNFIGFTDADMATPPEEYWKLVKASLKCDGAIADRYAKGSIIMPKPKFRRLIAKRAFNFAARALLMISYNDTQCGAKVFRREALAEVLKDISMSEWAFDVELLYLLQKRNFAIASIPIKWFDEKYSTINFWKSGPNMVLGIVRLRMLNSPLRIFINAYDRLAERIKHEKA